MCTFQSHRRLEIGRSAGVLLPLDFYEEITCTLDSCSLSLLRIDICWFGVAVIIASDSALCFLWRLVCPRRWPACFSSYGISFGHGVLLLFTRFGKGLSDYSFPSGSKVQTVVAVAACGQNEHNGPSESSNKSCKSHLTFIVFIPRPSVTTFPGCAMY